MKLFIKLASTTLFLIFLNSPTQAKIFRNAYVSFELPAENWSCILEQTEWICRSIDTKFSKEAIIILTAKEVGPTDSFDAYIKHLGTIQPTAFKNPGTTTSKVVYPPKQVKINDHIWIDGLQLASEVPNYYTRYLATIKDKVAVLVTLSAHKNFYTKYSKDFFKTVQSLRVIASKNLLGQPQMGPLSKSNESLGGNLSGVIPGDLLAQGEGEGFDPSSGSKNTKNLIMALAIGLAAIGVYLLVKGKKN